MLYVTSILLNLLMTLDMVYLGDAHSNSGGQVLKMSENPHQSGSRKDYMEQNTCPPYPITAN